MTVETPSAARPTPTTRDRDSSTDRWLAVIRIVVGLWFAKGAVTKVGWYLVGGVLPVPGASARWIEVMPRLLGRYAESTPLEWYGDFITGVVLTQPTLFAHMTALGETAVGIGLLLGLLTPVAAAVGLVVIVNYGLATLGAGNCQPGFHLLLTTCMVAFIGARAGRTWGVDGWLERRRSVRGPGAQAASTD